MEPPLVSICIPTYNRANRIGDTINSILLQTFEDYELIVVDNCSTDNTEEVVACYQDKRIRFIRNERNIGAPENHNRSLLEAKGKYLKFLHSDDIFVSHDALQKLVETAIRHPKAGVITCQFRLDSAMNRYGSPIDLFRPKGFISVRQCLNIYSDFGLPSEWLVKREVFYYTGMFIDSPVCDADLVMKMLYHFDSFSIADVLVEHRDHNDRESRKGETGWVELMFQALHQNLFYHCLPNAERSIICSYLHMIWLQGIRGKIGNEDYPAASQEITKLLQLDPQLSYYKDEDRIRALSKLHDLVANRRSPSEIFDVMANQSDSKPYADLFHYGISFRYQLYQLEQKLKSEKKRICLVGTGYFAKKFLKAFPTCKHLLDFVLDTDLGEPIESIEGIPVKKEMNIDFQKYFVILASSGLFMDRCELTKAGFVEGEHFLPVIEDANYTIHF